MPTGSLAQRVLVSWKRANTGSPVPDRRLVTWLVYFLLVAEHARRRYRKVQPVRSGFLVQGTGPQG